MKGKKIIILDQGSGRMANQLWNFIAIYAYALEKKYDCENWADFEYDCYFQKSSPKNIFIRILFFNPLVSGVKNKIYRKWIVRRLFKKIIYDKIIKKAAYRTKKDRLIDNKGKNFFLPPSVSQNKNHKRELEMAESNSGNKIYFYGWPFKNPEGIKKHRNKITTRLKPKRKYEKKANDLINGLKNKYKNIIGVHIRQGDYKAPENRLRYFDETEVKKILEDYLSFFKKNKKETVFVICSDGPVNHNSFKDLNIEISESNEIEDLLILSKTDTVIGADSTYGDFAAFYGNVPFIVFERSRMDWNYYKDKEKYFFNKKAMLHKNSE